MEIGGGSAANIDSSLREPLGIPSNQEHDMVALKDEEVKIKGYLEEQTNGLDVISIVGMFGLGKTTLASNIFHDKAIQFKFNTRIWVSVSQDFKLRDILLKILKQIVDLDVSCYTDQDLAQAVRAYLEGGQFLLVMDDVWTIKDWNAIRRVLPNGNKECKVLITSRDTNVGNHANPARKPLHLRFLTPTESWNLLQYKVFGALGRCPDELEGIGRSIANQCDGLPLPIVVIGGYLADHFTTTQQMSVIRQAWDEVSENVSNNVKNYDKEGYFANVIALSYKNLSDELRNCFIYLGVFPEDYEISAWTLTRLWIAEGFIQHKDGESLEETAEGNLNDLINRNLVLVERRNACGKVKSCRVHDMIREFCIAKAGIEEQNLFEEIKFSREGVFDPPVSNIGMYRRLCIHSHIPMFLSQKRLAGPKIRSFLCSNKSTFTLNARFIAWIPEAFNLLRVLETKSFKFTHFPAGLAKLIHLRYITLSFDNLDVLPESISKLWNLQTFLIDTKSRWLEIRANIWKLKQLRHLKTKAAIHIVARGEAEQACKNLQTLTRVSPEYCNKEVLNRAPNIKRLGIRGNLATLLERNYSFAMLGDLENLTMVNELQYAPSSENPLPYLPEANFFPVSLQKLTLSATYLDWSHMSTLGRISSLQVLKLDDNAFTGRAWNAKDHGFHALLFLLIRNSDLVFWEASTTDFPKLRSIELKNCEKLREIPAGMESLQKLILDRVGKSAVECGKKIKMEKEQMHGLELILGPGCM